MVHFESNSQSPVCFLMHRDLTCQSAISTLLFPTSIDAQSPMWQDIPNGGTDSPEGGGPSAKGSKKTALNLTSLGMICLGSFWLPDAHNEALAPQN